MEVLQRRYVKCSDDNNPADEEDVEGNIQEREQTEPETCKRRQVVYGLEDIPPWYATILFGFQVSFKSTFPRNMLLLYTLKSILFPNF